MNKVLFILAIFFSFNLNAMCDFPFNPSAYCLKFKIASKRPVKKFTPFKCEYILKESTFYRPPNTYHFDSNLEKVKHSKFSDVTGENSDRIKNPKKLYSDNCELKEGSAIVTYLSCYDTWDHIPDFLFLTNGKTKQKILDPWVQKKVAIDCSNI